MPRNRLNLLLGLLLVACGLLVQLARAQQPAPRPVVYVVPVEGVIDLGLAPFVSRVLDEAARAGAAAVVLDIDTFGGRVDAAVQIRDALLASPLRTVAFVDRRAISAGALIALSATTIAMAPGGTIGAAAPVHAGAPGAAAMPVQEKTVSYVRKEFGATAEARGRPQQLAEAMVDADIEVKGVIDKGKLLTLTTDEALKHKVADLRADSLDKLLPQLGLEGAEVRKPTPHWAEELVRLLTHPVFSSLLISIGMVGILVELRTPGFGVAGTIGIGSLALFFYGHWLVQLAGWEELLLAALGLLLLAVEIFVTPGFGVVGALGILALLGGLALSLVGAGATTEVMMAAVSRIVLAVVAALLAGLLLLRFFQGCLSRAGWCWRPIWAPGPAMARRPRPTSAGSAGRARQLGAAPGRHCRLRPRARGRRRRRRHDRSRRAHRGDPRRWQPDRRASRGIHTEGELMQELIGSMGALVVVVVFLALLLYLVPVPLWIAAWASGAYVGLFTLIAMRLRRVPPTTIVTARISAVKAGIDISLNDLEAHFLAGGNVVRVVNAMISADKANIPLPFKRAAAIDLAGRNVLEAVQMSVLPKVIETPRIAAVAKDGIQLIVVSRVTVRTNIDRLVGGAGEETIIARVGEGMVSTIGSAQSHRTCWRTLTTSPSTSCPRGWTQVRPTRSCRSTSPTSTWARTSAPSCRSTRPTPTSRSPRPRPRNAARWRWRWSRRCARAWSRPKPRCRVRWPRPSARATWA